MVIHCIVHLKLTRCHFNAKINDATFVAVTISSACTVATIIMLVMKPEQVANIVTHDQFIYI